MQTSDQLNNVQHATFNGGKRLYCLTFDYPPMHGGVARYLSSLGKASNGQVKVLVPLEHPLVPPDTSYQLLVTKFWWSGWPKWLPLVKRCLELKEGIIFVSHVVPIGTAAWISRLFGGPDYVVLFHGTDLQRLKSKWKRWLLRRICSQARLLVTNSEATKTALQRLMPQADALVMTPGVESVDRMSKLEARKGLGVDENAKVILAVCRLVERKGVDTLLQALSLFDIQRSGNSTFSEAEIRDSIELVVIGSGPYAPQLHQLADLLKIKVRWVENASDEEVARWYDGADVFCLPSREAADDVEGFGIVFLEAAAHGLPVIAGRGWGTEEAVVDGITGLLVKPDAESVAKALEVMLSDEDLRQRLGEAGRKRVEKDFKWEDRWKILKSNIEYRISNVASDQKSVNSTFSEAEIQRSGHSIFEDIAVIIPCYNHANELEAALESISKQILMPSEIIVVDNNSDDAPKLVVEKYANRLPVKYFRYEEKQGAPAARNKGASLTSAPLLLFMDADVQLRSDALQLMAEALRIHPDTAFAYSDFYWGRKLFKGREWDAEALKKMNWINTTSLIRRTSLVPFDEDLKKFQDWDLWLAMSERGEKGVWIPETLLTVTEVKTRKTNISHWLPTFAHRLPWPIFGWTPNEIIRYRAAEAVIRRKHHLDFIGSPGLRLTSPEDDKNI
ncbi:MAG: glycosyltransferase [Patescibacteria group bacterium]|nr:glycosyltransferase [Patescibacteria group bacterium]